MQKFRFQITPKQVPVILLLLGMLALPVGLVVWGLTQREALSPAAKESPAAAESGQDGFLKQSLESIAEDTLAPVPLLEESRDQILAVVDPGHAAELAGRLAGELGGTALPPEETGDGGVRVVFTIPEESLAEFSRRLALVAGAEFQVPSGGGVLSVRFERAARP
ncbi:MAG: hypothetical protein Fur0032_16580 [Terrimicrobiaceae bacterium]